MPASLNPSTSLERVGGSQVNKSKKKAGTLGASPATASTTPLTPSSEPIKIRPRRRSSVYSESSNDAETAVGSKTVLRVGQRVRREKDESRREVRRRLFLEGDDLEDDEDELGGADGVDLHNGEHFGLPPTMQDAHELMPSQFSVPVGIGQGNPASKAPWWRLNQQQVDSIRSMLLENTPSTDYSRAAEMLTSQPLRFTSSVRRGRLPDSPPETLPLRGSVTPVFDSTVHALGPDDEKEDSSDGDDDEEVGDTSRSKHSLKAPPKMDLSASVPEDGFGSRPEARTPIRKDRKTAEGHDESIKIPQSNSTDSVTSSPEAQAGSHRRGTDMTKSTELQRSTSGSSVHNRNYSSESRDTLPPPPPPLRPLTGVKGVMMAGHFRSQEEYYKNERFWRGRKSLHVCVTFIVFAILFEFCTLVLVLLMNSNSLSLFFLLSVLSNAAKHTLPPHTTDIVIPRWESICTAPVVRKMWDRNGVPASLRGVVWPLELERSHPLPDKGTISVVDYYTFAPPSDSHKDGSMDSSGSVGSPAGRQRRRSIEVCDSLFNIYIYISF